MTMTDDLVWDLTLGTLGLGYSSALAGLVSAPPGARGCGASAQAQAPPRRTDAVSR